MNMETSTKSAVRKCLEVVIITLHLLFWFPYVGRLAWLDNSPRIKIPLNDMIRSKLEDKCKSDTHGIVNTERVTVQNIEQIFKENSRNYKTSVVRYVEVFSSPLNAPFSSSGNFRNWFQKQYTAVDYHAFVGLQTNDGIMWVLDKMADGIYVSWGRSHTAAVSCFQGKPRGEPIFQEVGDQSSSTLSDLVRLLKNNFLKSNEYDLFNSNCQHFSRKIFDKIATDHSWDLSTPTDLTSPLRLFRNSGLPLLRIFLLTFFLGELYLLWRRSKENESFRHLIWAIIIALFIVVTVHIHPEGEKYDNLIGLQNIFGTNLFVAHILECFFFSPLSTMRQRLKSYFESRRSGVGWFRYLLIPLCMMAYVFTFITVVYQQYRNFAKNASWPLRIVRWYIDHALEAMPIPLLLFLSYLAAFSVLELQS